eukprot:3344512-Pyramimonas_sp.AAC.2
MVHRREAAGSTSMCQVDQKKPDADIGIAPRPRRPAPDRGSVAARGPEVSRSKTDGEIEIHEVGAIEIKMAAGLH